MVLAGWPLARRKEDSVIVKIKRLTPTAKIPTRGSKEAAGLDLYADGETVVLYPGETKMIHTGIAMEIKPGVFGAIYPRSGLASKYGLRLANCVGVIDSDYRGEIGIPLRNDGGTIKGIKAGTDDHRAVSGCGADRGGRAWRYRARCRWIREHREVTM